MPNAKPPAAGMGRPKGAKNKSTKLLKDAILKAAAAVGEDGKGKEELVGYCKFLATKEPKSFAMLIGKVIPIQVSGDPENPITHALKVEFVSTNGT